MSDEIDKESSHAITTTMWKFAVGLVALVFAGLLFVNEQFLTIREHVEYKTRVDGAISDIQTSLRNHTANDNISFVSRNEFDRWLKQHDTQNTAINQSIARIEATRPTTGELQSTSIGFADRIKRLEEQVQFLQRWQKKVNEQQR